MEKNKFLEGVILLSDHNIDLCVPVRTQLKNKRSMLRVIDSPTERRKTERRMYVHRMNQHRMTEHRMTEHRMTEHRKTLSLKIPNTE